MTATPSGWLCPACLAGKTCISRAGEVEQAPRYGANGAGGASVSLPVDTAARAAQRLGLYIVDNLGGFPNDV